MEQPNSNRETVHFTPNSVGEYSVLLMSSKKNSGVAPTQPTLSLPLNGKKFWFTKQKQELLDRV